MTLTSVWSFWTKPHSAGRNASWASDWHHWLAWGLSVHAARQHYPDTALVTDDAGARILVDTLELPFARVSTALNSLDDADPQWWALGKLEAYRRQTAPFVHIDADVFLWEPLRPELGEYGVFAQNPEPIPSLRTCYRPDLLEQGLGYPGDGWLPREWRWYRAARSTWRAECCGVFGGSRIDFIRHYAARGLRIASDPRNRDRLDRMPDKAAHMILLEQYLLSACLDYHAGHPGSRFADVSVGYVFDRLERANSQAEAVGYTHLAAGAKRDRRVCDDLEWRVKKDLPRFYERCCRRLGRQPGDNGPAAGFAA
jgi:hypothetical protein